MQHNDFLSLEIKLKDEFHNQPTLRSIEVRLVLSRRIENNFYCSLCKNRYFVLKLNRVNMKRENETKRIIFCKYMKLMIEVTLKFYVFLSYTFFCVCLYIINV